MIDFIKNYKYELLGLAVTSIAMVLMFNQHPEPPEKVCIASHVELAYTPIPTMSGNQVTIVHQFVPETICDKYRILDEEDKAEWRMLHK